MTMLNIKSFFALTAVILGCAVTGLAQQGISPEKRVLIQELRELTGVGALSLSASLSSTPNAHEPFTAQIEKDPELTDAQKQELKTFIFLGTERMHSQVRDFFADKAMMKQLSDEVGFQLYDKTFTDAELQELITFYRTPTGRKAAGFMSTVKEQLTKAFTEAFDKRLGEFLKPKMQARQEEFQQKIREAKIPKNEN
jgi:hypothetical protein